MESQNETPMEAAARLIADHEAALRSAIESIIKYDRDLVDETFSDVKLAILNSWQKYDPARCFRSWASGIARNLAKTNLTKELGRRSQISDLGLEQLVLACSYQDEDFNASRLEALHRCVRHLPPRHQRLVILRWGIKGAYRHLAKLLKKSKGSLRVILHRLHNQLRDCVDREPHNP